MPHEFTEYEYEPEAQAASSRGGGPPRHVAGADVLDWPAPPARPSGSRDPLLMGILAAAIVVGLLMLWFYR